MALICKTMLLLTKGVREYIVIWLLEVIWKLCAPIINNQLRSSIDINDALHGFRQGRGTGTTTLEANLDQHLVGL